MSEVREEYPVTIKCMNKNITITDFSESSQVFSSAKFPKYTSEL